MVEWLTDRMDLGFGSATGAGLSRRDLAARIGLDFSSISKVENGRLPPPAADIIVALCRVLDIAPEDSLAPTGKIPAAVQQAAPRACTTTGVSP